MKKNTWITIAVTGGVCIATLLWQRAGIAKLEDKVTSAKADIQSLEVSGSTSKQVRNKQPIALGSGTTPGKPRLASTPVSPAGKLSARELLQLIPDDRGDPAAMIRMLPDLLNKLEPYSADDLFDLVSALNEMSDEQAKAQSITGLLLLLLTGVEPEGVLEFAKNQRGTSNHGVMEEVQTVAFSALARKDPEAARKLLESSGWKDHLKEQAQLGLVRELARKDFPAALEYIREGSLKENKTMSVLAVAARDTAVRNNMLEALTYIEDAAMRNKLATSVVGATFTESGFEGVSTLLETMDFPDVEARDKALLGAANLALLTQPIETVEWVQREVSAARRGQYLANSIRSWAYKDYNAAGAWLETQESSPDKDAAVSAFATTVVNLDQEAAAVWTGQIQDETMRGTARRRVMREWHRRNEQAARAWLETQDLNPADWLPPTPATTPAE